MSVRMIAAVLALWAFGSGGGAAAQTSTDITFFPPQNETACVGTPTAPGTAAHYLTWYNGATQTSCSSGQNVLTNALPVDPNTGQACGSTPGVQQVIAFTGSQYICETGYAVQEKFSHNMQMQSFYYTDNMTCPSGFTAGSPVGQCWFQTSDGSVLGTGFLGGHSSGSCNMTNISCSGATCSFNYGDVGAPEGSPFLASTSTMTCTGVVWQ